jgi:uncharacterized protein (DUF433 family)
VKTASVLQDAPAYPLGEAARYVRLAPTTLSSWLYGRPYPTAKGIGRFEPLIRPADSKRRLLSFNNLVEAHVLRALRTTHRMELKPIRSAITYAERHLGIDRLLLSRELLTDRQSVFLEHYGELINLSHSGQVTLRVLLNAYLQRIDRDDSGMPLRLFPFVRGESDAGPKHIAIDPAIGFGRPIVRSRGVSTHAIVDRIDAGESVADVATDYGLAQQEVEEAIVYERAA